MSRAAKVRSGRVPIPCPKQPPRSSRDHRVWLSVSTLYGSAEFSAETNGEVS